MLPNKTKALHLVRQGFQVIPIGVNPDGSNIYNATSWKSTIINTEKVVETYWYGDLDRRVAVVHPTIGVIDVDVKNGKNGFDSLKEAGYELPDTYNYETKSGGRHYIVRFPAGTVKSVPVEGVDIQVANGIFVWYGDVLSDEELANIADAPVWALQGKPEKKTIKADPIDWFNSLPQGEYTSDVERILGWASLQYPNINHEGIIKGQFALLSEGAKGAVGVPEALMELKSRYLQGEFNTSEYEKEWNDGLEGVVIERAGELDAIAEANTDEARIESMAKDIFIKNQAQALAKRMEAEKYATGVKRYTWDELEAMEVNWAIDGMLAYGTNTMLVGAPNIGKTFLYVDWMGCSISGLPWAGRDTTPAKFMVVIGEGATGWSDRLKAWCAENGQDYKKVRESIVPMSTASLSSDSDVDQMRIIAHAEKVDFIIFDTWNTNSGMSDENANAEAAMAMNAAGRIKPDAGVLIIHHPNAETQNTSTLKARGATAVQGKMDFVVTMFQQKKEKEFDGVDDKYITVSTLDVNGGKSRHSERLRITGLYLKDVLDTRVMCYGASGDIHNFQEKWFRRHATGRPYSKAEVIASATANNEKISPRTFDNYVDNLGAGKVRITTEGNKKFYEWVYDNTEGLTF